jgi:hypothetical protein
MSCPTSDTNIGQYTTVSVGHQPVKHRSGTPSRAAHSHTLLLHAEHPAAHPAHFVAYAFALSLSSVMSDLCDSTSAALQASKAPSNRDTSWDRDSGGSWYLGILFLGGGEGEGGEGVCVCVFEDGVGKDGEVAAGWQQPELQLLDRGCQVDLMMCKQGFAGREQCASK